MLSTQMLKALAHAHGDALTFGTELLPLVVYASLFWRSWHSDTFWYRRPASDKIALLQLYGSFECQTDSHDCHARHDHESRARVQY